jgi:small subunit ribosomal protein S20
MANIESAKKRIRQSAERQARNRALRSRVRGAIKKFRGGPETERPEMLGATVSEIDRAKKKGVLHRNAAARYKSRLARRAAAASK